jgi:C4-dicarboxylate-specific signal transduction histidine kinase
MEAIALADSKLREVIVTTRLSGKTLDVRVEDTGPGIDPKVTLFKQFETNKANGMGLGLSICRTIMEANGGRLWYDAKNKARTRFCLTLRVHNEILC